jgi:lipopolysaccharide transport system ATP-binding protein
MLPAIRVTGLGKRYQLGMTHSRSIRELVNSSLRRLLRRPDESSLNRQGPTPAKQSLDGEGRFWALRDVSFDIMPGESIGIIGRNGAGKSTILKILSRITSPSCGRVEMNGRVASLLEVGTGFHSELSGRENVFLNGALLGLRKSEIQKRFDEIVAFSEIEKFIDTPVKRYSSGMYVRLAFAVAAHLDPEILIVDEVLAVGDAAFQRKCLGKMDKVSLQGRTVLFVSHNLSVVRQLCRRCIVFESGRILADGATDQSLRTYGKLLRSHDLTSPESVQERLRGHTGAVRFVSVKTEDSKGHECTDFRMGETINFRVAYEVAESVPSLVFSFSIFSGLSREVVSTYKKVISTNGLPAGTRASCLLQLPEISLRPGEYYPYFWFGSENGIAFDRIDSLFNGLLPPFTVSTDDEDPDMAKGYFSIPAHVIEP